MELKEPPPGSSGTADDVLLAGSGSDLLIGDGSTSLLTGGVGPDEETTLSGDGLIGV